jgi:hypothetical protein
MTSASVSLADRFLLCFYHYADNFRLTFRTRVSLPGFVSCQSGIVALVDLNGVRSGNVPTYKRFMGSLTREGRVGRVAGRSKGIPFKRADLKKSIIESKGLHWLQEHTLSSACITWIPEVISWEKNHETATPRRTIFCASMTRVI